MGSSPGRDYLDLLSRQRENYVAATMVGARAVRWKPVRLAAERERRLRDLLAWAAAESPFHRDRLRGIDVDGFTEADLPRLPVLTKSEVMENFDELVTDRQLSLDLVNRHVETLDTDSYLLDRYRVVSTGGSTGTRGLFLYDWDEWCTFAAIATRWQSPEVMGLGRGHLTASFFASNPRHVSGALHAFFHNLPTDDTEELLYLPASLPFQEIVSRLNDSVPPPVVLTGYPSIVLLLAREAQAGRLHVSPRHVATCGEQCGTDVKDAVREAWGVPVWDYWGCTEGVYAYPCDQGTGMHLPDDMVVVEVVDADKRPVPDGTPGESILLTVLYNKTQPLIRYEIGDRLAVNKDVCACGCAHSRIDSILGRSGITFVYPDGPAVHSLGMESILLAADWIAESQVDQTPRGVEIHVASRGTPDYEGLESRFEELLRASGLPDPKVTVTEVPIAARLWSGKLQQFSPLTER